MRQNILTTHVRHFDLIKQLIKRDVDMRFKGALLGVLWPLITPLMTLAMYAVVFGYFLPSRWPGVEGITGFLKCLSNVGALGLDRFCRERIDKHFK